MSKEDFIEVIHEEINKEFAKEVYQISVEDIEYLSVVLVTINIYSDFNSAYSIQQQFPYELMKRGDVVRNDIRMALKRMHGQAVDYINENSDWDLSLKQYL